MNNFTFENTTRIHFGKNQIEQITKEIPQDKKVLIIYGAGSIKKNGVYEQISNALKNHNWGEFSGIEPNPEYATLMQAVEKVKKEKFEYLLAVGGGSVIDGTKFISAASCYEGEDPWNLIKNQEEVKNALPLSCVLTLPATGSESNCGAVINKDKEKLVFFSSLIRPKFAVLDPSLTFSLSPRQVSNGIVDAFIHVLEQYLTYPVNAKVQDRFSEGLMLTLLEESQKVFENPDDLEIRSNIMLSATLALNGLISSGVPQDWTTHMIGHELTAYCGVDHARSLTVILIAILKVCRKAKEQKLLQYAKHVFNIDEANLEKSIDLAISKTIDFFKQMKMPTSLEEIGLSEKDIEPILKNLEEHGRTKLGENGDITIEKSREILLAAI